MKELKDYVLTIPDFPEPGVMFRDITSVLQDADGLRLAEEFLEFGVKHRTVYIHSDDIRLTKLIKKSLFPIIFLINKNFMHLLENLHYICSLYHETTNLIKNKT